MTHKQNFAAEGTVNNNINQEGIYMNTSRFNVTGTSIEAVVAHNSNKINEIKKFFELKKSIMAAPDDPFLALNDQDSAMTKDVAKVINTPIAYPVMTYFTMLSTLLGNSLELVVGKNRKINMTLWTCLVGFSGTGKSPVQNFFFNPLREIDRSDWISNGMLNNSKKDVKYANTAFPQVITGATKYHTEYALEQNSHGITLAPDEISSILSSWSSVGRDFLISAYDGANLTYCRGKNDIREIPRGFISILGGIQPNRVKTTFKEKDRASGFVQRMLFVDGIANKIRQLNPESSGFDIKSEERRDRITEALSQLDFNFDDEPQRLQLNKAAYKLYCNWANKLSVEQFIHRFSDVSGMFAKFAIIPLKIAAMLKCADLVDTIDFGDSELHIDVEEDDMLRAIYVTNWLLQSQKNFWELYFDCTMLCTSLEEAVTIAVVENEAEIRMSGGHITSDRLAEMSERFFEKKVNASSVGRAASALGFTRERGTDASPSVRGWYISEADIHGCKEKIGIVEDNSEDFDSMPQQ